MYSPPGHCSLREWKKYPNRLHTAKTGRGYGETARDSVGVELPCHGTLRTATYAHFVKYVITLCAYLGRRFAPLCGPRQAKTRDQQAAVPLERLFSRSLHGSGRKSESFAKLPGVADAAGWQAYDWFFADGVAAGFAEAASGVLVTFDRALAGRGGWAWGEMPSLLLTCERTCCSGYWGSWVESQPPPRARMSSTLEAKRRLRRLASVRWLAMRVFCAVSTSR